jgi:hypothetical protein
MTAPRRLALLSTCAIILLIIWYNKLFRTLLRTSGSITDITTHAISPSSAAPNDTPSPDLSSARAPFIAWPLQRLCTEQAESKSLVPGLIFLCDNNSGGPGNIRNYILTCVRYAIEAGATGLQIPRIRTRSASNKADLFREYRPFGYMFSEAHFRDAMAAACPHIALYPSDAALENIPGVAAKAAREHRPPERMVRRVTPKEFGGLRGGCDQRDQNRYTDQFGPAFRQWVRDTVAELHLRPTSPEEPMLVRLSWGVLWDWPIIRDGPEFAASFGGLLRIREDILQLADSIVWQIRELAASVVVKSGGRSDNDTPPDGLFLGVHLRTEEDALSQWPTYENQSKGYFQKAEELGFGGGMAYLASGSEKEARRFAEDAQAHLQLTVKSKYDLVFGRDLEKLRALSWDQQALVDFAVLLQSDYLVGVSPSSFSINLALKRHLRKEGLYTRPWKVGSSDERSWLVGQYEKYWDNWLFMFDGMWP